jgi:hypothetical protein
VIKAWAVGFPIVSQTVAICVLQHQEPRGRRAPGETEDCPAALLTTHVQLVGALEREVGHDGDRTGGREQPVAAGGR